MNKTILAMTLGCLLSTTALSAVFAETTLRLDEVPVGELDPAIASDYGDSILMFNVYDALVAPKAGVSEIEGLLANDWTIDGNVFTFNLKDNVTFHSGNPMTAKDVVFSFERSKALGKGLSYLYADRLDSVEAVDDYTVKFTLNEAFAPFLTALVRVPIVDSELVKANLGEGEGEMGDWGQAYLSTHDAGTGAYQIDTHNPQEETVMKKAEAYFGDVDEKSPDTVRLRYGLEPATVRTLISKGEHDIASQWLPPEVAGSIAKDGGQLLKEKNAGGFYMKLNTQRAPLDDIHCRKALVHAVDYDTLLRMVAVTDDVSAGSPATGALSATMMGAGKSPAIKQDMDLAKAELEQCKYKGDELKIDVAWIAEVPLEERFALLAQSNFNELGFESNIIKMPWALFTEAVQDPANTPHVNQLFNSSSTGDPDPLLYGMYHSSSAGTWSASEHLNDPKVDELLVAARGEMDLVKRAEIYAELDAYLLEQAVTIYGYDRASVFAASDRVAVPALTDDTMRYNADGFGFNFRLMQMAE